MAYLLDETIIKRPSNIRKEPIEVAADHITISGKTKRDITARKYRYILSYGKTKRDITARKYRYILSYKNISKTDADTLVTIYNQKAVVTFQSTEANFPVSLRNVHVDIGDRDYLYPGSDYLSTFNLILTEEDE